jgi:hypothetical protein
MGSRDLSCAHLRGRLCVAVPHHHIPDDVPGTPWPRNIKSGSDPRGTGTFRPANKYEKNKRTKRKREREERIEDREIRGGEIYFANSRAAARPIPLAAPVTTAMRPACRTGCSSRSIGEMSDSTRNGVVGGRNGEGPEGPRSPIGMVVGWVE